MGASLTCVSCLGRGKEEVDGVTPVTPADAERVVDKILQAQITAHFEAQDQKEKEKAAEVVKPPADGQTTAAAVSDPQEHGQTSAVVNPQKKESCEPAPMSTPSGKGSDELKDQINAIVNARKQMKGCDSQNWIDAIVGAHETSLQQQRLTCASVGDLACSPSPAKSLSDSELAFFANSILSSAKERQSGPGMSPSPTPSPTMNWTSYEDIPDEIAPLHFGPDEIAPLHLSFADGAAEFSDVRQDVITTNQVETNVRPALAPAPHMDCDEKQQKVEKPAVALGLIEIPSPTRSRAKKPQAIVEKNEEIPESWEEIPLTQRIDQVIEQMIKTEVIEQMIETEEIEQADDFLKAYEEEEARLKEIEEAKLARELEEQAEMLAMDKMCVRTFLESVKRYAWRERVRTPIKGTNLYTKHMRPCRPAGTSVDVKDSNFRNLGNFLKFLEEEGLLRLQPGLTDPVVTAINFSACQRYKYHGNFQG